MTADALMSGHTSAWRAATAHPFLAGVRDGLPPGGTVTAVMEPTGMAWFPVARWLEQAGIKVIRVKGQRVRALRRYLSEHAKTDAADAYVLGAIPFFGGVPADPVYFHKLVHAGTALCGALFEAERAGHSRATLRDLLDPIGLGADCQATMRHQRFMRT